MNSSIVKFTRPNRDRIYQIQLANMERRMMWAVQEVLDSISRDNLSEMFEDINE